MSIFLLPVSTNGNHYQLAWTENMEFLQYSDGDDEYESPPSSNKETVPGKAVAIADEDLAATVSFAVSGSHAWDAAASSSDGSDNDSLQDNNNSKHNKSTKKISKDATETLKQLLDSNNIIPAYLSGEKTFQVPLLSKDSNSSTKKPIIPVVINPAPAASSSSAVVKGGNPTSKSSVTKAIKTSNAETPINKETAKDRVKRQRLSGQSGIGEGFKEWRSEEEMRLRQTYD